MEVGAWFCGQALPKVLARQTFDFGPRPNKLDCGLAEPGGPQQHEAQALPRARLPKQAVLKNGRMASNAGHCLQASNDQLLVSASKARRRQGSLPEWAETRSGSGRKPRARPRRGDAQLHPKQHPPLFHMKHRAKQIKRQKPTSSPLIKKPGEARLYNEAKLSLKECPAGRDCALSTNPPTPKPRRQFSKNCRSGSRRFCTSRAKAHGSGSVVLWASPT